VFNEADILNFELAAKEFKDKVWPKYARKIGRKLYMRKRLKYDLDFRLKHNLRSRFYNAIKRGSKKGSVLDLLGCSIKDLKKHLETQFIEGMTWENYGQWEIDHILPLNRCNVNKKMELEKFCHFSNLRPLWMSDNRKREK